MKKLLWASFGTAAALMPIIAVVSCGTNETKQQEQNTTEQTQDVTTPAQQVLTGESHEIPAQPVTLVATDKFATVDEAWNGLLAALQAKDSSVAYLPKRDGGTIYRGIANLYGGYDDARLNIYKGAVTAYFGLGSDEQKIEAISLAIQAIA